MQMRELTRRMQAGEDIPRREAAAMVLALSVPAVLEQIVSTAMSYIDTGMVGDLGAGASAAIGTVASTTWLFGGALVSIAVGFSVQVAQALGAGREDDARGILRQAIRFNVLSGILIGLLAFALSFVLPGLLGADPAIRAEATAYFAIWGLGLPFSMAAGLYSALLRSTGDTRTPSLLNIAMCLLDVVFNFLLINPTRTVQVMGLPLRVWGAGLGVAGAALGTVLATALCAGAMLAVLCLRPGVLCMQEHPASWKFSPGVLRNLARLAIPVFLERSCLNLAQILSVRLIGGIGVTAVAAHHVATTAEGVCYMPAYGIQVAVTPLVGQSIGAGRRDMAKRFAYLSTALGMGIMLLTGAGMFAAAPALTGLLTADAAVIALGAQVLRIEALAEPLFGASIVATGAMRGAGYVNGPFFINLATMWGIRLTLALLLVGRLGLVGVWLPMCIELNVRGLIFILVLARGKWLNAILKA